MQKYILRTSVKPFPGFYMWTYIFIHYDLQVYRYGEVNSYIYAILVSEYQNFGQRTDGLSTLQTIDFSLMFVPCIAWLDIIDQHYALIITPLFITQAPTCFGIYVPSSGSVLYLYELLWRAEMVVLQSGTVNIGDLCAPDVVVSCVTLSSWA
jgi:hypothetical protein